MHLWYRSNNFWRPHGGPLVWECQWPSSQPLSFPQLSHNDSLWAQGIAKSHRDQGQDYRKAEELCWCPSWSNSLWQGWSCRLVHFPGGNGTDSIWSVLASSLGISAWTWRHSLPRDILTYIPRFSDQEVQWRGKSYWNWLGFIVDLL